ncbi:MAG: tetratricopeptide repeat protein [Bacteroidales bacterium]|nr:tetratricopeptide repeat protein [Bacteroidales bacterium]
MQGLRSYYRLLILTLVLGMAPMLGFAQSGRAKLMRERDSLINIISKESDARRLAVLNLELANRYDMLENIAKVNEAAEKAVSHAKTAEDYNTLLNAYLLLGQNNISEQPVSAIQNYLSARKVIEKRANLIMESEQVGGKSREQQKIDKEILHQDKITDADIVQQIGLVYFGRGHYSRAIESFERALEAYEKLKCEDQALVTKKYLDTWCSLTGDTEQAITHYDSLLNQYKDRDDWESTRMVYQRLSEIYNKQKNYQKVFELNKELYEECLKHNNMKESLNAYNNLAYSMVNLKQYDKAVEFYTNLLEKLDPQFNDQLTLANTYTNLGMCYQNMGGHEDQATDNIKKALQICQHEEDQDVKSANLGNILALIYLKDQDLHNAEYYCVSAVDAAERSKDTATIMALYETYSKILKAKGDHEGAFKYNDKYLKLKEIGDVRSTLDNQRKAEELKKLTDAEKYYQEDLVAQEINEMTDKQFKMLAEQREKELEMARQREKIQEMERAQLEQANRLMKQQMEAQKREQEIQKLQLEQEKAALELDRQHQAELELKAKNELLQAEQDRQKTAIELQKAKSKQFEYFLYLALAVVLFFVVLFFLVRKKNKKLKEQQAEIEQKNANLVAANNEILTKNEELERQKAIIEQANKSITDSIVYAKRIQTAVCPSPDFLSSFNFDYFLFFRPRDIVSGDYYWFYADDKNHIFIVAADCTGHGVPGAFMSMLGLSLFNKIVAERQIIEPGDILTTLRNEVKAALHQDSINSSQKDGMDLSLVRYDVDTNMLHFAGANNNGYLVKRFSFEEEEEAKKDLVKPDHIRETPYGFLRLVPMPADSMPIGVYIREKERFTQTSYQLRRGDSFYLTSDGYIDQYGGQHGRKFLSKNFQQMLMDINSHDMKRQEKIVIDTHEEWIGDSFDQLDDIIVIGIRV